MPPKKMKVTQEEVDKLYDPETFYQHGDNPANRQYMEIMTENNREAKFQDYRTWSQNSSTRFFLARNVNDFLERDLKLITAPRAVAAITGASLGLVGLQCGVCRLYPVGQYGIKSVRQTQMWHMFGLSGLAMVGAVTASAYYIWWQTAKFATNKIYRNCILGERNWQYEQQRQQGSVGEYYFNDVPLSCVEAMPDLARGEMGKKSLYKPTFAANQ